MNELPATLDKPEAGALLPPSSLLGRVELPSHFEVLLGDRDWMLATSQERFEADQTWQAAKVELRKRGYVIWEFQCERRKAHVASCTKRPNCGAKRPAGNDSKPT